MGSSASGTLRRPPALPPPPPPPPALGGSAAAPPVRPRRPASSSPNPPNGRIALVVAVFTVIILFGTGAIEFWTDAIWYESVDFDGIFWTRVWASIALFVGGAAITLVVLLGNLWIANRLAPPSEGKPGSIRELLERLGQAGLAAGEPPYPGRNSKPL